MANSSEFDVELARQNSAAYIGQLCWNKAWKCSMVEANHAYKCTHSINMQSTHSKSKKHYWPLASSDN